MSLSRLVVIAAVMLGLHADEMPAHDAAANRPLFRAGSYPIFSSAFTGSPSPFHETANALIAKGARLQAPGVSQALWRQGLQQLRPASYHVPIYLGSEHHPAYVFACVTYGRCAAAGMRTHLPPGAAPSDDSDHHLISFDRSLHGELDGWGGDGNAANACNIVDRTVACSWGGFFPFSGNGLDGGTGNSGNNGGYAFGLFLITAQEVVQGHIDHALGLVVSCLDDPDIYPADSNKKTDTSCSGGSGNGNPQYGQLFRLKPSYDIAASAYSPECKTILTAFQTYGAYTYDTNARYGIAFGIEDTSLYDESNPWYTAIFPHMAHFGDGTGSGTNFRFPSCLNRVDPSDVAVYDLAPGS